MTLLEYNIRERETRQLVDHTRCNTIQAAVILVTLRYGDEAGEWLLAQLDPPRGTPAMFAEWGTE